MGRSGRAAEQRRSGCDLEEQRHRERSLPSEGSDASPPLHDEEALLAASCTGRTVDSHSLRGSGAARTGARRAARPAQGHMRRDSGLRRPRGSPGVLQSSCARRRARHSRTRSPAAPLLGGERASSSQRR